MFLCHFRRAGLVDLFVPLLQSRRTLTMSSLKNELTMRLCTVGLNMFYSLQFGGDNTKTVFVAEWIAFFGVPLMPRVGRRSLSCLP